MARDGEAGADTLYPAGLRGDIAKFLSPAGTHAGKPSLRDAAGRVLTRPGPLALVLYRLSNRLWREGHTTKAELVFHLNLFLTGADIHPGAEIGGGLRLTHTSGQLGGAAVPTGLSGSAAG